MAEHPERPLERKEAISILETLTGAEQHFNSLQAIYRGMASTWLLATFGGVGFLATGGMLRGDGWLLAAGVGLLGIVGQVLLWNLDLMVLHRLLDACFAEGLRFERAFPELPQVRHHMMRLQGGEGVLSRVVWFYLGCIGACGVIGAGSSILWGLARDGRFALLMLMLWVGFLAWLRSWMCRRTSSTRLLLEEILKARPS